MSEKRPRYRPDCSHRRADQTREGDWVQVCPVGEGAQRFLAEIVSVDETAQRGNRRVIVDTPEGKTSIGGGTSVRRPK